MRAAHNHRPNGLRARDENGFLTCAQCGQPCNEPEPKTVERSPLPVGPAVSGVVRPKMERDGILAVMSAGNRLAEAVTTFAELGYTDLAHSLDDVLADLSSVGDTIPAVLDAGSLAVVPDEDAAPHTALHRRENP